MRVEIMKKIHLLLILNTKSSHNIEKLYKVKPDKLDLWNCETFSGLFLEAILDSTLI